MIENHYKHLIERRKAAIQTESIVSFSWSSVNTMGKYPEGCQKLSMFNILGKLFDSK